MKPDIKDAHPLLQQAWPELSKDFTNETGMVLRLTCVARSVEEQQELYAQGRTKPGKIVTQVDGVNRKSEHNKMPSRAIDVCVVRNGKVTWDPEHYKDLGRLSVAYGLEWGGHWKTFKDLPHIQVPKHVA